MNASCGHVGAAVERYVRSVYDAGVRRLTDYTQSIVEHLVLATVAYVLVCLVLYALINRGHGLRFERTFQRPRRVLLVTAHPDDECMFFGPTVYRLTREPQCRVFVLCLSAGDAAGLGKRRKQELWDACGVLGVRSCDVCVYNCTQLPDDPAVRWREDVVAQIISRHVEALDADTLLTFDKHGVSRHPNHCSIYYAVAYLTMERRLPATCKVFTLESINLLRKYWLVLDLPVSYVFSTHRYVLRWAHRRVVLHAMRQHRSQLVWFRRLYLAFSRYTVINTFQQLDTIDLELDLSLDD